jgi:hypothetical protein
VSAWRPISEEFLRTIVEGRVYLTQHEDDLFPVPAYRMGGMWLRETEGPEDVFYGGSRHCPLYRAPTHFMPLPEPPS